MHQIHVLGLLRSTILEPGKAGGPFLYLHAFDNATIGFGVMAMWAILHSMLVIVRHDCIFYISPDIVGYISCPRVPNRRHTSGPPVLSPHTNHSRSDQKSHDNADKGPWHAEEHEYLRKNRWEAWMERVALGLSRWRQTHTHPAVIESQPWMTGWLRYAKQN